EVELLGLPLAAGSADSRRTAGPARATRTTSSLFLSATRSAIALLTLAAVGASFASFLPREVVKTRTWVKLAFLSSNTSASFSTSFSVYLSDAKAECLYSVTPTSRAYFLPLAARGADSADNDADSVRAVRSSTGAKTRSMGFPPSARTLPLRRTDADGRASCAKQDFCYLFGDERRL